MEKKIKIFVIFYFLINSISISFAQRREVKPVEFNKISENLYEILEGRGARGGTYIGDNGVLIIDAKMNEESVKQVLDGIKQLTDKPIKYLVNTHSDGDHINGNKLFPGTITFIAHENCRKDFFRNKRDGSPSQWKNPDLAPFIPSITFQDKMDLYLGTNKVELWYFGVGHTTGDAVVYFREEKTAFLGDQIFLTRPQLIHSYKGGNSFEHVKTLTKMLETIDAEKFCSGHSEMTNREGINNHIAQMKKRQEKVKALFTEGRSLDEVKSKFEKNEGRLVEVIYNEVKGL